MSAERTPAIVLIGFMGAGKTTTAKSLATALRRRRIDSDQLLAEQFGIPVAQIFADHGEAAFREAEEKLVCELLDSADGEIISLGGGSVVSEKVQEALAPHTVVLLEIDRQTSWGRVKRSGRPLAKNRNAFDRLYDERRPLYERLADVITPQFDRRKIAGFAEAVASAPAAKGATMLWAPVPDGGYPVWLAPNLLSSIPPWPLPEGSRRIAISDQNVAELHAGKVPNLSGLVEFAAGEENKTLATCEMVWGALVDQGVTRSDHVVAIGGGVVGDLAGFVASTYQRGIPVVQVPTTLVAQVDSSLGGKTGVDLPTAKNYVGAYHQPAAVMIDPELLQTLPQEELAAGYAEVVKTALIAGGELWQQVSSGAPVDPLTIMRCARTKLGVVASDERDGGRRQVLNLGHTIGHAIETVTSYARYRHGEAVGLGLLAALQISGQDQLRSDVSALLANAGLPVNVDPTVDLDAVALATAKDKKRLGSAPVPFVTVAEPGDVRFGQQIPEAEVVAAIASLR